jgi:hypothetical protein
MVGLSPSSLPSSASTSSFVCNEIQGNLFLGVKALLALALTIVSSHLLFLGRW